MPAAGQSLSVEHREALRVLHTIHGGWKTGAYKSWEGMRTRCNNPNAEKFHHYGGRGITVCERWNSYANFLADMGPRPEGRSLDRVNNDGNYEPENCRWATAQEQRANRRDSQRKE